MTSDAFFKFGGIILGLVCGVVQGVRGLRLYRKVTSPHVLANYFARGLADGLSLFGLFVMGLVITGVVGPERVQSQFPALIGVTYSLVLTAMSVVARPQLPSVFWPDEQTRDAAPQAIEGSSGTSAAAKKQQQVGTD